MASKTDGKHVTSNLPDHKDLVYGDALDSLVFIPRTRAEDFAGIRTLLDSGPTWAQFRKAAPSRLRKEAAAWFSAKDRPADDEPFSPPWLIADEWPFFHQEQLELLPKDVIELGTAVATTLSGDRLDFPYSSEKEIVKRLKLDGFKVERDDALVRQAYGLIDDDKTGSSDKRSPSR